MSGLIYGGTNSSEETQAATVKMIWVQNLWITLICVPYLILLKTKPDDESQLPDDKKKQSIDMPVDAKVELLVEDVDRDQENNDTKNKEIHKHEEPSFLKAI